MEIAVLLVLVVLGAAIFYFKNQSTQNHKSSAVKKTEIIENYENQIKEVLHRYKDDNTKQLEEKTKLLKQINSELSRNIFFTPEESKQVIQYLLTIK